MRTPLIDGFVYVVECDHGIKIGWTGDPAKRFANLGRQFGEPYVWACVPGTRRDERGLHHRFRAHRISGDWFRWGDELIAACEDGTLLERSGGLCKFSRGAA